MPLLPLLVDGLLVSVALSLPTAITIGLRRRQVPSATRTLLIALALFVGAIGLQAVLRLLALLLPEALLPFDAAQVALALAAVGLIVFGVPVVGELMSLRTAAELAAARQQAEEEAGSRALAEEAALQAQTGMDRAVRELEQFAYITSHDLQTPLRTIAGFSQLLNRRHRDKLDGDALEFLDYIEKGTQQMTQQIQDLLALSRVGRVGSMQIERKPLADTVGRAIRALRPEIERSGAEIVFGTLPEIEANHGMLAQLLQQLLDNALKFRRPGERPRIEIEIGRDDAHWLLTMTDNGIGIPEEHLDAVFAIFRRLHAPTAYPGTGMGLAICRKIAEHHGGSIRASSDGSGTRIHLHLPVAVPKPRAAGTPTEFRGG